MAFYCTICSRTFPTRRRYCTHAREHKHPQAVPLRSRLYYHPRINGRPCNIFGAFLPRGAPPPPREPLDGFAPFKDRPSFEFAELIFEKMLCSRDDIDQLLRIWSAKNVVDNTGTDPVFDTHQDVLNTIDAIPWGEAPWYSFKIRWNGPLTPTSPGWKRAEYVVHAQNPLQVFENMLDDGEFAKRFHPTAYQEFTDIGGRRYSHFMSGQWAWKESDKIAADASTHGAMLATVISGADKTTVSVATGNQEFHPVYASLGVFHSDVRRGHQNAVLPIAFLAIPKGSSEDENDPDFRIFKKQIYHAALAHIFDPLKPHMSTPRVTRCPDGHYRKVIYSLGPFMADYPEQVYLSGVVQGCCPKCFAPTDSLEAGQRRTREIMQTIKETYSHDPAVLWDAFGIAPGVIPFTDHFPRADIHEALSPDLLHQVIKGTFKDHLVEWVLVYIKTHHSAHDANAIIADLDRRCVWIPLMVLAIFIPAIKGLVPDRVVQCVSAFLDFCYIARRSSHDNESLQEMEDKLAEFHDLRDVFRDEDVRDGFALPRQHALAHLHIRAVKRPWRAMNKNNPLIQILGINSRLNKLAAARSVFGSHGMLRYDVLTAARRDAEPELFEDDLPDADMDHDGDHDRDAGRRGELDAENQHFQDIDGVEGDPEPVSIVLAKTPVCSRSIARLDLPPRIKDLLLDLIRRLLYDQLNPAEDYDSESEAEEVDIDDCPLFHGHVALYYSARAFYYAPSELCGPGGMHSEMIRSHPNWYGTGERRDTVLVQDGLDDGVMGGMLIGRVLAFLSFSHNEVTYPCALVEWFFPVGDAPDAVTVP
ncbi:hypothetical protein EVJ58_g8134 [Rhodofomes roseus]|uniref:C2H2-type domain-containing protein n=1 Tax=Rhodofomes roseus TaxID=34475 RepID=A0A4Y9Y1L6_9APHY|nr:hypothetical protein EVJ58_g8134 [Rhodofomes roseus]